MGNDIDLKTTNMLLLVVEIRACSTVPVLRVKWNIVNHDYMTTPDQRIQLIQDKVDKMDDPYYIRVD